MISSNEFQQLLQIVDFEERATRYAQINKEVTKLSVAENMLLFDFLQKHVFKKLRTLTPSDVKYFTGEDRAKLLKEVVNLLNKGLEGDIGEKNIFGVAGVSAALECLAFALLKDERKDNKVIIPTPCWQGFDWCFGQRANYEVIKFDTENGQITFEEIKEAVETHQPKILVLTNPSNPLGINYKKETLEAIYDWVLNNTETHIISDEIYAHSQVSGAFPAFVSALNLDAYKFNTNREQVDRVHVVWGVAKDLGLSGFKTGFIISTSDIVQDTLNDSTENGVMTKGIQWFTPIDTLKNWVLMELFTKKMPNKEQLVVDAALAFYKSELTKVRRLTEASLKSNGIDFFKKTNAAQFFWLDLSKYLKCDIPKSNQYLYPDLPEQERLLTAYIRDEAKVLILPGLVLSNSKPGWFRMCYTAEKWDKRSPENEVEKAITRMGTALKKLRGCN